MCTLAPLPPPPEPPPPLEDEPNDWQTEFAVAPKAVGGGPAFVKWLDAMSEGELQRVTRSAESFNEAERAWRLSLKGVAKPENPRNKRPFSSLVSYRNALGNAFLRWRASDAGQASRCCYKVGYANSTSEFSMIGG